MSCSRRDDTSKKYPVVYLLHGFGGDHFDWNRGDCYVQDIYGNMLANNTAVPAIVVMPDMYTAPADTKETADGEQKRAAYDKLVYDLENELMPYIESHYAVKTGRENTAIIGTSQGGTEALAIGFLLQDKIGYIGSLAPCPGVIPTPYNEGTYWNTPLMDDFTIESPAMAPYYLQLAAGTTDPWCLEPTKYYENVLTDEQIALFLMGVLDSLQLNFKRTTRRGQQIVYCKDSASIEEILTMVGATGSMMDVVNVKIYKDMRNKVNRVTNCETSNIEKTVSAATVQAADIRYLQQRGLFDTMEVPLKQTAQARLENPDMSLRELGELLGVSRSGINHRLQKISQLAKQARDEEICGGPQKK